MSWSEGEDVVDAIGAKFDPDENESETLAIGQPFNTTEQSRNSSANASNVQEMTENFNQVSVSSPSTGGQYDPAVNTSGAHDPESSFSADGLDNDEHGSDYNESLLDETQDSLPPPSTVFINPCTKDENNSDECLRTVVLLHNGITQEEKEDLKYLCAACFTQREIENFEHGLRDVFCNILQKRKLPVAFIAKLLREVGDLQLISEHLLLPEWKDKPMKEIREMLVQELTDEKVLFSDEVRSCMDPTLLFYRFTLYRAAQEFLKVNFKKLSGFIKSRDLLQQNAIEESKEAEHLFTALEKKDKLAFNNLHILDEFAKDHMKDTKLREILDTYKATRDRELGAFVDENHQSDGPSATPRAPAIQTYDMSAKPRGICAILAYGVGGDRRGAEADIDNLRDTFFKLGYYVEVHLNTTAEESRNIMVDYAERNHSSFSSFVCCILGHGQMVGQIDQIMCADRIENLDTFLDVMNPPSCETLVGKPKLFFINICRTPPPDNPDSSMNTSDSFDASRSGQPNIPEMSSQPQRMADTPGRQGAAPAVVSSGLVPQHADVLKAYSAADGTKSNRNTVKGSWYIKELCDVLRTNYQRHNLVAMLTLVNERVCSKKNKQLEDTVAQAPMPKHTLRKLIFFSDNLPNTTK